MGFELSFDLNSPKGQFEKSIKFWYADVMFHNPIPRTKFKKFKKVIIYQTHKKNG